MERERGEKQRGVRGKSLGEDGAIDGLGVTDETYRWNISTKVRSGEQCRMFGVKAFVLP